MSKRWILLLGLLAVCGLVACRSTDAPTPEPEATAPPKATATEGKATATEVKAEATATQAQESRPAAKPATESKPEATPTPAWQIPEVREGEWTKGADDAGLVIVEYSDYQ
jgi:hypothetical protein